MCTHTQTHAHSLGVYTATADRHIYIKYTLSWVFLSPKKKTTTTTKLVLKSMLCFWRSGLAYLPLIFACVCVCLLWYLNNVNVPCSLVFDLGSACQRGIQRIYVSSAARATFANCFARQFHGTPTGKQCTRQVWMCVRHTHKYSYTYERTCVHMCLLKLSEIQLRIDCPHGINAAYTQCEVCETALGHKFN